MHLDSDHVYNRMTNTVEVTYHLAPGQERIDMDNQYIVGEVSMEVDLRYIRNEDILIKCYGFTDCQVGHRIFHNGYVPNHGSIRFNIPRVFLDNTLRDMVICSSEGYPKVMLVFSTCDQGIDPGFACKHSVIWADYSYIKVK